MSNRNDSQAHPGRKLPLAAVSAAALAIALGGGACSTSTLQPATTGTAGTSGDSGSSGGEATAGSSGTGVGGSSGGEATAGSSGTGVGGSGGGEATAGSSGTGVGGSGGAGGSSCAVVHRATSVVCPPSVASAMQVCASDVDCVGVAGFSAAGRCIPFDGQMLCSYDTCFSDEQCGASPAVCLCKGQWRVYAAVSPGNGCRSGNCRVDSDCPGSVCSPSVGFGATFYGYAGYYCHTPQDQCQCDSDCASPTGSCAYNPEIGAWACASFGGAG